ncbi:hypothetical protein [Streptomyces sp. enrichment culture]|uniref:hypothetical protein n=1 Tax=Streptomyces sp. enrichment culture TaxID=1795815 RepID=UPI003F559AD1
MPEPVGVDGPGARETAAQEARMRAARRGHSPSPGPSSAGNARTGRRAGTVLAAVGAALAAVGSALYVLPGPGLPVLAVGLVALTAGLVAAAAGRRG